MLAGPNGPHPSTFVQQPVSRRLSGRKGVVARPFLLITVVRRTTMGVEPVLDHSVMSQMESGFLPKRIGLLEKEKAKGTKESATLPASCVEPGCCERERCYSLFPLATRQAAHVFRHPPALIHPHTPTTGWVDPRSGRHAGANASTRSARRSQRYARKGLASTESTALRMSPFPVLRPGMLALGCRAADCRHGPKPWAARGSEPPPQ